jgi:hypothetical protein
MKMSRFETVRFLLVIFSIALAGQACSDQSLQQYREQQAQSDLDAQLPAAGNYTGSVTALNQVAGASAALGTMTVSLQVAQMAQESSDNLGTESRAVLEGTIQYSGPNSLTGSASITNANYDPDSGDFSADVTLTDDTGASHSMMISATINGGEMSGEVIVDSQTSYGGKIELSKNGSTTGSSEASLSSSGRGLELDSEAVTYTASVNGTSYGMTIDDRNQSTSQAFLQVFLPVHDINLGITVAGDYYNFVNGSSGAVAQIDYTNGTITATTTTTSGGVVHVDCTEQATGEIAPNWLCNINGIQVLFMPTQSSLSSIKSAAK